MAISADPDDVASDHERLCWLTECSISQGAKF